MNGLVFPVKNPVITSDYGPRVLQGKKGFHDGVDVVSRESDKVYSIGDGEVVYDKDNYQHNDRWTDREDSAGNYLIILTQIGNEYYYVRYLHLGENYVSVGEQVPAGREIGFYGDYGYSFGAHLHNDFYTQSWAKIDPYEVPLIADMYRRIKEGV